MLAGISATELLEWQAYSRVRGPLGPERADLRAALGAWATVASHSQKPRRHKLDQFILKWDRPAAPDHDLDDDEDDPDLIEGDVIEGDPDLIEDDDE